jgi:hypothetical protein
MVSAGRTSRLLLLTRDDLRVDLALIGRSIALVRDAVTLVGESLALGCCSVSLVCLTIPLHGPGIGGALTHGFSRVTAILNFLALIGERPPHFLGDLTLVGIAITLVRGSVARVGNTIALVRQSVTLVGSSCPFASRPSPVQGQSHARTSH